MARTLEGSGRAMAGRDSTIGSGTGVACTAPAWRTWQAKQWKLDVEEGDR
ncbi:MAG: hypothetical protein HY905_20000 [Deltaproteobacteria bacterium]|nr:hypothetical protein [Deltaproteobacteria bacterium]